MGSLGHGGFEGQLASLPPRPSLNDSDAALARSALMWLSVAQRPLHARELWIALQAGDGEDYEQVKRVLAESAHVDEEEAVSSLPKILGGLVTTRPDADNPRNVYVKLDDYNLGDVRYPKGKVGEQGPALAFDFSSSQAHLFVAKVCMAICGLTALPLGNAGTKNTASSIVSYTWDHWRTHLSLSGCILRDNNIASSADRMFQGVCTDTLVLLLNLNDFITRPITFSARHDRARCHVLVKEAQEALGKPIMLLSRLVQQRQHSKTLEAARELFESSKSCDSTTQAAAKGMSTTNMSSGSQPTSAVDTLRLANLIKSLGSLLGEHEGQIVRSYADVAPGLRETALLFNQSPLHEALLKEYNSEVSPLGILAKVSRWLEAVASYPVLGVLPTESCIFIDSRESSNFEHGANGPEPSHTWKDRPGGSDKAILQLAGISPLRWNAARLVFKIKNPPSRSSTFTINAKRRDRASSFTSFPLAMADIPSPITTVVLHLFYRLTRFLPTPLCRLYHRYLHRPITHLGNHALLTPPSSLHQRFNTTAANPPKPLSGSCPGAGVSASPNDTLTSTQLNNHTHHPHKPPSPPPPPPSSFNLAHILPAATLNHIRRTLLPWLGGGHLYRRHPLEDLRLAVSNPEVFMQEMLDGGFWAFWWGVMGCFAVKGVVDFLGGLLGGYVGLEVMGRAGEGDETGSMDVGMGVVGDGGVGRGGEGGRFMRLSQGRPGKGDGEVGKEMWLEVVKVGYLLWVFITSEYVFARGMNTAAWLVACYKLLAGSQVGRRALGIVLATHWHNIPLTAWLLVYHLRDGCWPLVRESVRCAVQGQPGMLMAVFGAVGGVTALLKYRSTFYIALQVSGMFIFFGFVLAGLAVLGLELWSDPLGLRVSTGLARVRGNRARNVLSHGESLNSERSSLLSQIEA